MKQPKIPHCPYRLYILVRNDLPSMNPGRAMAQAAHAANQLVFEHGRDKRVREWQCDRGFGTTICLAADKVTIQLTCGKASDLKDVFSEFVYDPTYKYSLDKEVAHFISKDTWTEDALFSSNGLVTLFRKELTCGYVFIHEDHPDRIQLLGQLPLHP